MIVVKNKATQLKIITNKGKRIKNITIIIIFITMKKSIFLFHYPYKKDNII